MMLKQTTQTVKQKWYNINLLSKKQYHLFFDFGAFGAFPKPVIYFFGILYSSEKKYESVRKEDTDVKLHLNPSKPNGLSNHYQGTKILLVRS